MVNDDRDLVSLMALLRASSVWERWLIPPFVFFFRMLYPFAAVNDPNSPVAAAAGGCVLVRREALDDAGGIEAIKGALIDDVALGRAIKRRPNGRGRIWLGLTEETASLRAHETLRPIWTMIERTADTQLRHSLLALAGTILGLVVVYLLPPVLALGLLCHGRLGLAMLGAAAWILMSIAYWPTIRLYGQSALWVPSLPAAALLYAGMTVSSAVQYRRGRGGLWKGRVFSD
jgi:hopene-associated glycosyltransferase HpnB